MADDRTLKVGSNELELIDFRLFKKEPDGSIYEGIYGINVAKVIEIINMLYFIFLFKRTN
jgi:two-component system chemotaxis response regulator CheV